MFDNSLHVFTNITDDFFKLNEAKFHLINIGKITIMLLIIPLSSVL